MVGTTVVEYFYAAILAWLDGDDAAGMAALAAGMTVHQNWRPKMLLILSTFPENQQPQLRQLVAALSAKEDWNMKDVAAAKRELSRVDKGYYKAMCNWYGKANPEVFLQRHPNLQDQRPYISTLASLAIE